MGQTFRDCAGHSREACGPTSLVVLGGDIIFSGSLRLDPYAPGAFEWYTLAATLAPLLFRGDIFFANFEGIFSCTRQSYFDNRGGLRFVSDSLISSSFKKSFLCPVLSFANNHCFDAEVEGIEATIAASAEGDFAAVGIGRNLSEALLPAVVELPTFSVGFVALTDLLSPSAYATEREAGALRLTRENLASAIKKAKAQADIVIVSLHTIGDIRAPLSFWPDKHQREFARYAASCGADVVIGHHPHGLQYAERYRGAFIFYSIGALFYDPAVTFMVSTTHPFYRATRVHGGAILTLELCRSGVHGLSLISSHVHLGNNGRPELTRGRRTRRLIARLLEGLLA